MANNLTMTGAVFDTTTQKFGTSALSGGYGVAPGAMFTGFPLAFSIWFKRATLPAALEVIMGQSGLGFIAMTTAGHIQFEVGAQGQQLDFTSTNAVADGAWHMATFSATAASSAFTLDGVVVATSAAAPAGVVLAAIGAVPDATGYLGVKNHGGSETYQFGGEVDESAAWNTNQYPGAFTVPTAAYTGAEAGLIALWHLDGNEFDSVSAAAETITVTTPASQVAGTAFAVAGTYTGAVPAALDWSLDGTTWTASTGAAPATGTYSIPGVTVATANAAQTVRVRDRAVPSVIGTSAAFAVTAGTPSLVTILPGNAALLFSPYGWAGGKTINAGSYISTTFTGNSVALTFDVSAQTAPLPQVWVSVDGQAPQQFTVAANISLVMPSSNAAWPRHTLEIVVKSTSEFVNRWSPQNAAVILTGIVLASGATVALPAPLPRRVLIFGDSITEGYHTVNSNAAGSDPDGSDAMLGWAYQQRRLLGVEVSVVGFGGASLSANGQGGVPSLGSSYNLLWAGQARAFTPAPDMVVVAYGENDNSNLAPFQAAYLAALQSLLAATPSTTRLVALSPLSGRSSIAIQAAVVSAASSRVTYVNTTGLFNTTLSVDGQHPLGVANLAAIGPGVAALLTPILIASATPKWTHI